MDKSAWLADASNDALKYATCLKQEITSFVFSNPWKSGCLLAALGYWSLRRSLSKLKVRDLAHKAVFITGCDSGFGRATVIKCARAGIPVYAGCYSVEGKKSIEEEAKGLSGRVVGVVLDVTSDESVNNAAEFVKKDLPHGTKLWALLNNAGIFTIYGPVDWCTVDEYKLAMDVNFYGVIRCTKAFLPLIKESRGRIGTTASIAGRFGVPNGSPYSASKFAVEAFMEGLAVELSQWKGLKCGVFEPGGFKATKLMDVDMQRRRVESVWKKIPVETRREYGEKFKEEFVANWNAEMDKTCADISPVVDSYFHFITAKHPGFRYKCGREAQWFWTPMTLIPSELSWTILSILGRRSPVPAVLKE